MEAVSGGDEVQELSAAFAMMAARLGEREAERRRLEPARTHGVQKSPNIKEKMDFATSAEMIRQAVRWVETLRLDEK